MIVSAATIAVIALLAGNPDGAAPTTTPTTATTASTAATGDGSASLTIYVNDGGTRVENKGKTSISVTPNEGKPQVVEAGARAEFAPVDPSKLPAPSLLKPNDKERVRVKPTEKGLGPIVLTWAPVAGAKEYEVEFKVENGQISRSKVQRTEFRLPPLPPGKVLWAVRSVADGAMSESAQRWFELQPDQLKLEAGAAGWK